MEQAEEAPKLSRGSAALKEKFGPKRSGAQKLCSERTKISQPRLSKLANGGAEPNLEEALVLEREEGIPVAWWKEPPVVEEAAPASERNPAPGKEGSAA
jgi:hypothetical protein